jgi:seryl-tRNA synthetase
MTDEPIDPHPSEEPQGGAATTELQKEVKQWQAAHSALALQIADLKQQLEQLPPGQTAEVAAIQDQLRNLTTELAETKQELATAKEELSQMRQSAPSGEGDNLTQGTRKAASSDQTGQPVPRPTRATRMGWV